MKTLIIDNFDSFTYNLFQQCAMLGGKPEVFVNNAISIQDILKKKYSHIILSAGPGSVEKPQDFGVCAEVLQEFTGKVPILGVCLGHQGIVYHCGGKIVKAPEPMHGKKSLIRLDVHNPLLKGLPQKIEVMRYHSLIASRKNFPSELEVIAETIEDAQIMAISHKTSALFGVQFHPESIGTALGKTIMKNFLSF